MRRIEYTQRALTAGVSMRVVSSAPCEAGSRARIFYEKKGIDDLGLDFHKRRVIRRIVLGDFHLDGCVLGVGAELDGLFIRGLMGLVIRFDLLLGEPEVLVNDLLKIKLRGEIHFFPFPVVAHFSLSASGVDLAFS